MRKTITRLLLGLMLVAVVSGFLYMRGLRPYYNLQNGDSCLYGHLPKDLYLDKYEVQTGDTLLSIAKNQLGSTSRISEVVNLNKNYPKFHSLYTDTNIEAGWNLHLSAKYLPPNTGELVALRGKLVIDTRTGLKGRTLVINDPKAFPTGTPTSFSETSTFFGTKSFKDGDCVVVIRDEGTGRDIVMGLQSELKPNKQPEVLFEYDEVQFPKAQTSCLYKFFDESEVMKTYIVEKGDTLRTIAEEHLGDQLRADEIRKANSEKYATLKTSDFIEIGWELMIPPKWVENKEGKVNAFAGTLLSENDKEYWIASSLKDPAHIRFTKDGDVNTFQQEHLSRGDCVVILDYRGSALGIARQDTDYLNLFRYDYNPID